MKIAFSEGLSLKMLFLCLSAWVWGKCIFSIFPTIYYWKKLVKKITRSWKYWFIKFSKAPPKEKNGNKEGLKYYPVFDVTAKGDHSLVKNQNRCLHCHCFLLRLVVIHKSLKEVSRSLLYRFYCYIALKES